MTTEMVTRLRDAVLRLATARRINAEMKARVVEVERPHATLYAERNRSTAVVGACEALLRTLAVEVYELTKNKKPMPGVSIAASKEMVISDPQAVREWCLAKQVCLTVDEDALAALAKAGEKIPGLTVREGSKATIATKLVELYPAMECADYQRILDLEAEVFSGNVDHADELAELQARARAVIEVIGVEGNPIPGVPDWVRDRFMAAAPAADPSPTETMIGALPDNPDEPEGFEEPPTTFEDRA